MKIEAFPFQQYGTLRGRLKSIAPDSSQKPANEGGEISFKAKVELSAQQLGEGPARRALSPGMVITGEIVTGKRAVLSYFLYPVLRVLDESIREP